MITPHLFFNIPSIWSFYQALDFTQPLYFNLRAPWSLILINLVRVAEGTRKAHMHRMDTCVPRKFTLLTPKSHTETHITLCNIDSQREFAVWLRKLKQGLCINLEEWGGLGVGREVQNGGDICIPVADSCRGLSENNKIL